ncbi:cardiotrophin-1 [Tiliqua scincoides]|uniref:cardiotrophin-1 n=1 Tax=Tiliqua scincoides TaxID=71010 RepID=UPI003461A5F3
MEVLPVDFAKRLSSSSSRSQQELAIKIKKTHNLTIVLQNGSKRLLKEYITCQGPPFGTPSFSASITPFPGLPLPSLSAKARLDLSDAERLQEDALAFSNLPAFLTTVLRQQTLLNPTATDLHQQLDTSQMQCLGLANNLKSIMASMGIMPGPAVPAEPPEEGSTFAMKTVGYQICQLYQVWASQSQEDLALLVAKYPV